MNVTTRTTLLCLSTAGVYTFIAYLCGASLPPTPYLVCLALMGPQVILCSNARSIARWIQGSEKPTVQSMKTEVWFVLIVCFGTAYSCLAKLRVQDGIEPGTRDGHEVFLIFVVPFVELGWAMIHGLTTMMDRSDLKRILRKRAQEAKKQ